LSLNFFSLFCLMAPFSHLSPPLLFFGVFFFCFFISFQTPPPRSIPPIAVRILCPPFPFLDRPQTVVSSMRSVPLLRPIPYFFIHSFSPSPFFFPFMRSSAAPSSVCDSLLRYYTGGFPLANHHQTEKHWWVGEGNPKKKNGKTNNTLGFSRHYHSISHSLAVAQIQ